MQERQVDLSGLTKIDVALSYIALKPAAVSVPPVSELGTNVRNMTTEVRDRDRTPVYGSGTARHPASRQGLLVP